MRLECKFLSVQYITFLQSIYMGWPLGTWGQAATPRPSSFTSSHTGNVKMIELRLMSSHGSLCRNYCEESGLEDCLSLYLQCISIDCLNCNLIFITMVVFLTIMKIILGGESKGGMPSLVFL